MIASYVKINSNTEISQLGSV